MVSTLFLLKPLNTFCYLNTFLLGEYYACNLSTDLAHIRLMIVLISAVLTAASTVLTLVPIVFLDMVLPHLSMILLKSVDHQRLFPCILLLLYDLDECFAFIQIVSGEHFVYLYHYSFAQLFFFVIYVVFLRPSKYLIGVFFPQEKAGFDLGGGYLHA